jgi:hypothetical protein
LGATRRIAELGNDYGSVNDTMYKLSDAELWTGVVMIMYRTMMTQWETQRVLGNSDEVSVMRTGRRGVAMRCQGLMMCHYLENGQVETVSTV